MSETTEQYKRILREILDILEGGDVSLDFEDAPSAATTLRIIANIAGTALRGVEAIEELHEALNRIDTHNHAINDHKELSK